MLKFLQIRALQRYTFSEHIDDSKLVLIHWPPIGSPPWNCIWNVHAVPRSDLCDKRKAEKERPCKAMNVSRVYYASQCAFPCHPCWFHSDLVSVFFKPDIVTLYIALDMNVKNLKLNLKLLEPDCALASARSRVRASAWIQPDCNDFKRLPLGIPRNFAHSHSRDFHETLM